MKKKIINFFRKNYFDLIAWIVCIGLITYTLSPILGNEIIAGWDLISHLYLVEKMAEFIRHGNVSGYDGNWFGGYPVFTFYGPLPYIIIALPNIVSFGLIPLNFLFNLFLFLLPLFFLFSIYYTSRIWFGKNNGPFSLFFGLLFLFYVKEFSYSGIGINAEIYLGLFSNLFAISLMMLLFGFIKNHELKKDKKTIITGSFLLAMIILTHVLTTLFTGVLLFILFLNKRKILWKKLILIFLFALLISSFWLIPMLTNINLISGGELGLIIEDPLFILYPKVNNIFIDPDLSQIPGLILLIFTIIGLAKLFKSNSNFWAYAFIFTLILLPREYLKYVLDLPVHYYRFLAHIATINVLIAGFGLEYIFKNMSKLKSSLRIILGITVSYLILLTLTISVFFNFDLMRGYYFHIDEYPDYERADEMLSYINKLHLSGRITTDALVSNQLNLGTPHFFFDLLPLRYDIPVFPGLLAESSLSGGFIIPTIASINENSLRWGNVDLLYDEIFNNQSIDSMIKRLGLYNTEYLLISGSDTERMISKLSDKNLISLEKKISTFMLFKLNSFKPLLEATDYKPFLFVDNGGINFKTFALEWYKNTDIFDYPVIYTNKSLDELSDYDLSNIGGFIISLKENSPLSHEEYQEWHGSGKNLIFLNAVAEFNVDNIDDVDVISPFEVNNGIKKMASLLKAFNENEIITKKIEPKVMEDEHIEFEANGGVLINYSYFPKWKSKSPEQTVFWATPTMMFVFSNGKSELFYD